MPELRIALPEKVKKVVDTIRAGGYEAYVVGGCVRDSVLGREPGDWDITTSAEPFQVKALFRRTIDTGIRHGTVTVMLGGEGFEVTTYRIDGKYEDGRHPKEVIFTPSLEEDLKRRDFTINAMAYNEAVGLVDLYGGLEDMERRVIRCVGDPVERFSEDALRLMRAIRFSAQLGFEIEESTKAAIRQMAPALKGISAERIQVELVKLVISDHPEVLRTAYDTGITSAFLPEFDRCMNTPQNHPHHCCGVGEHILRAMKESPADKDIRLAMLLHDIGKPEAVTVDDNGVTHFHGHSGIGAELAKRILRRLKFDNRTIHRVAKLVRYHDYGNGVTPDRRIVRRAVNKLGDDIFPELFEVRRADIMAQSEYLREEKLENLEEWRKLYEEILDRRECISLKELAVTGKDLIALGMKPGMEIGETLNGLLQLVLEEPEHNTREYLLDQVKNSLAAASGIAVK